MCHQIGIQPRLSLESSLEAYLKVVTHKREETMTTKVCKFRLNFRVHVALKIKALQCYLPLRMYKAGVLPVGSRMERMQNE